MQVCQLALTLLIAGEKMALIMVWSWSNTIILMIQVDVLYLSSVILLFQLLYTPLLTNTVIPPPNNSFLFPPLKALTAMFSTHYHQDY